jgi:NADPH-dependent 2,4-dienoyl-CoA reductase/sulfur reductase-like enzyme
VPLENVLIVGASLGGLRTAEALRFEGYSGNIILAGDEASLPYDRPPLSKQFLKGEWDEDRIRLRSAEQLANELAIELHLGVTAKALRVSENIVEFRDGKQMRFDAAVIATGARARTLPQAKSHRSAHVVRSIEDSKRLRALLTNGSKVVVIGAGFIGAEVASTAKFNGCHVTIVESARNPLQRQLGTEMGGACAALHARNGVTLLCDTSVNDFAIDSVTLSTGQTLQADVVVVGVGAQPNTEWLETSDVLINDGIVTDEFCRVYRANGDVYDNVVAVGDVARFPNRRYRPLDETGPAPTMRIEHWTNAAEMATHCAKTLLGKPEPYEPVPYFWSDQYKHKIQFFGRADGFDEVQIVEGDIADASWVALYRRGDNLVAALGVSKIRALMGYRALLMRNASWTEAMAMAGSA